MHAHNVKGGEGGDREGAGRDQYGAGRFWRRAASRVPAIIDRHCHRAEGCDSVEAERERHSAPGFELRPHVVGAFKNAQRIQFGGVEPSLSGSALPLSTICSLRSIIPLPK